MPLPSRCSSDVRRFVGSSTDELTILCVPSPLSDDPGQQAEVAYRELLAVLGREGASPADVVGESLFLRDIQGDLVAILASRERVLAESGAPEALPQPSFVEQPPAASAAAFALLVRVVRAHRGADRIVEDIVASGNCACDACRRSGARRIRIGEQASLVSTNLYGVGKDPEEQAENLFESAERLLAVCGLSFRDVVRTWIFLRDIDRDYDALNRARRRFFERCGLTLRPASTGVGGRPLPEGHDLSIGLYAVQGIAATGMSPIATPLLNEAWSYGADFSRGVRIADAGHTAIHISGTASLDEVGRTVHVGDFEAQAQRMLDNIESLLIGQGATFADIVSAVTYLRRAADGARMRSIFAQRGFANFPCVLVEAPLCRPDLLCETEAVARLPLAPATA